MMDLFGNKARDNRIDHLEDVVMDLREQIAALTTPNEPVMLANITRKDTSGRLLGKGNKPEIVEGNNGAESI